MDTESFRYMRTYFYAISRDECDHFNTQLSVF